MPDALARGAGGHPQSEPSSFWTASGSDQRRAPGPCAGAVLSGHQSELRVIKTVASSRQTTGQGCRVTAWPWERLAAPGPAGARLAGGAPACGEAPAGRSPALDLSLGHI